MWEYVTGFLIDNIFAHGSSRCGHKRRNSGLRLDVCHVEINVCEKYLYALCVGLMDVEVAAFIKGHHM